MALQRQRIQYSLRILCWCIVTISQTHRGSAFCPLRQHQTTTSLHRPPLPSTALHQSTSSSDLFVSQTCLSGVTTSQTPLNEAVQKICKAHNVHLTLKDCSEIIHIGAVWARMEALQADDLLDQYNYDSFDGKNSARLMYADVDNQQATTTGAETINLDDYVEKLQHQRYRRILSQCIIEAGTDLRIYPYPRRFDGSKLSILYQDTTFLVVNKPSMLPTQPDASNYFECVPGVLDQMFGPFQTIAGDLVLRPMLCHRVDRCVSGVVVLSKDKNGQAIFHKFQRARKLRKMYLSLTAQPVPLGLHVHWMYANKSRGGGGGPPCQLLSHRLPENRRAARQSWQRCVLEVTHCEPVPYHHENNNNNNNNNKTYYQSTIRLVTGRKHQVRVQLASLGCPILYDTLYEPLSGMTLERSEEELDAAIAQCRVPCRPIGLQAAGILFGGIKVRAPAPWWESSSE